MKVPRHPRARKAVFGSYGDMCGESHSYMHSGACEVLDPYTIQTFDIRDKPFIHQLYNNVATK